MVFVVDVRRCAQLPTGVLRIYGGLGLGWRAVGAQRVGNEFGIVGLLLVVDSCGCDAP